MVIAVLSKEREVIYKPKEENSSEMVALAERQHFRNGGLTGSMVTLIELVSKRT